MNVFTTGMTVSRFKPLAMLLLSVVLAMVMLVIYNERRIQADDFALGKENTSRTESIEGVQFTAHNIAEIKGVVDHYAAEQKGERRPGRKGVVLWLGNSQLHTINQFRKGEHLAPYWLREYAGCGECISPLGLSLSNASPQEELVLSQFVQSYLALDVLVLEVEFMGFRESGLRKEFSQIASARIVDALRDSSVSKEFGALSEGEEANAGEKEDIKISHSNPAKQDVEGFLTETLGSIWPLWKDRGNLRSNFLGDLFTFRNWVFGISSASQRKIIKPRYQKNMKALEELLARSKAVSLPVVLYIAPVRQDKPLPYDSVEYAQWKEQIEQLAKSYSASFLNLEKLVPAGDWGSNFGEDIDFMHFQETGHKILAKELLPVIQAKMK